jgi:hypothetical protein
MRLGCGVRCAALRCSQTNTEARCVFHAVEWGQVTRRGPRGCGVGGARDTPPVRRRGRPLDLRHVSRLLTAVGRSVVCVLDPPRSRAHRGSFARSTLRVYPCIRFSVWSFDGSDKLERCDHLLHCMLIQSVCTIEIRSYTIRASHLTTSRASLD